MTARKIHDLRDFCLGDLVAEHANNGQPFLVHGQHNLERLRVIEPEKALQNQHNKFHRRENHRSVT